MALKVQQPFWYTLLISAHMINLKEKLNESEKLSDRKYTQKKYISSLKQWNFDKAYMLGISTT